MALIQWESMRDIEDLFDRYTRSLAWPAGRAAGPAGMGDWHPKVDIRENESGYVIEADIPGVAKEDQTRLVGEAPRSVMAPIAASARS